MSFLVGFTYVGRVTPSERLDGSALSRNERLTSDSEIIVSTLNKQTKLILYLTQPSTYKTSMHHYFAFQR